MTQEFTSGDYETIIHQEPITSEISKTFYKMKKKNQQSKNH